MYYINFTLQTFNPSYLHIQPTGWVDETDDTADKSKGGFKLPWQK